MIIYTDGSARHYNGEWIGAYSFAIYNEDKSIYQIAQNIIPATVNASELIGVISAIHYCTHNYKNEPIEIRSDSKYVVDGMKNPLHMKSNTKYWKLVADLIRNIQIEFTYVRAHASDIRNKHVDKLAKDKLRSYIKELDS